LQRAGAQQRLVEAGELVAAQQGYVAGDVHAVGAAAAQRALTLAHDIEVNPIRQRFIGFEKPAEELRGVRDALDAVAERAVEQHARLLRPGGDHPLDHPVHRLVTDGEPLAEQLPLLRCGVLDREGCRGGAHAGRDRPRPVRVACRNGHAHGIPPRPPPVDNMCRQHKVGVRRLSTKHRGPPMAPSAPVANPLEQLTLEQLRLRTSMKWRVHPPDVLPLWVAEMDVPLADPIAEALTTAVARGDTGYAAGARRYAEAFAGFAARRWGWS